MPQPVNQAFRSARGAPLEVFWEKLSMRGKRYRRSYPRIHANVPVHIVTAASGTVSLHSNDLSWRGMQLRCDRATAMRLRPQTSAEGAKPTYPVVLQLEVAGMALRVGVHGRIVHLALMPGAAPPEEVIIGVEFVSFVDGAEEVLQRFVEQHLCPAGF